MKSGSGSKASLKQALRLEAIKARDSIGPEAKAALDRKIARAVAGLAEFQKAHKVFIYASFRTEVDTREIIEACFELSKTVVLPRVNRAEGTLSKHVVTGMHEVCKGYMGIPEPSTDSCIRVEDVDIVIVPGVAFSAGGQRIGYGGGYYDRLLPRIKGRVPIVALAYEQQIVGHIQAEGHDVPMDRIVTPERIIDCGGQGKD